MRCRFSGPGRGRSPPTRTGWWTDTLNIGPGEIYQVTFVADNPGLWMDHCHNFKHAADGMIMHLGYVGTSPYLGSARPE
jgi:FtsP/CotA-like multicopper oxidase with cupredoxin domain